MIEIYGFTNTILKTSPSETFGRLLLFCLCYWVYQGDTPSRGDDMPSLSFLRPHSLLFLESRVILFSSFLPPFMRLLSS